SNITSAAELAVGLLLAVARNIPAADASLQGGQWKRSKYTGVELDGKTVGVLGFGRIGILFAQRMVPFGVEVLAYDPYVPAARAAQAGARLVSLEELLATSDFISVHLPKTAETAGLIGAAELAKMKPGVRIVNAAGGGLVDEVALAEAVRSGHVAGVGLDVFAKEPCTDSPLFGLPGVVVTPHLGASTVEAQDKAGLAVARSVKLALQGEFVPDAVNVQAGGMVAEEIRPARPLMEKRGRLFTALAGGVAQGITVEVRGEMASVDVSVLQLAALKGIFSTVVEEQVTFVNAPLLAKERGLEVGLATYEESEEFRNLLTVRGVLASGDRVSVSGTLFGRHNVEKLTEVNGFDVDVRPEEHLLFLTYLDRPGVVGAVGAGVGGANINIAGARVPRTRRGGAALMVLSVDQALPNDLLNRIAQRVGASDARSVDLAAEVTPGSDDEEPGSEDEE